MWMDIGAILSRSLSLYKRNLNLVLPHLVEYLLDLLVLLVFGIFAAIVLVSTLGSVNIASVASLLYGPPPFFLITYVIFAIVAFFLIATLFNAFARAAIIGMAIEARKDGKTSLDTGLKSAKKHGLGIFGYTLIVGIVPALVIGVIVFVGLFIAFVSVGMEAGPDFGFALLAFIIFFVLALLVGYIVIYVLALFSPQKIVIENCGLVDGIKASFGFVRNHPTEVVIYIGFAVAVGVITSLISMVFAVPGIVFELLDSRFTAMFFRIFENLASIIVGLLVAPYLETVKTLMVLEAGGKSNEVESSPVL